MAILRGKLCHRLLKSFIQMNSCVNMQQSRTTVILKRVNEAPLHKEKDRVKLRKKHDIYELVEGAQRTTTPPIQCFLTDYVEGYGNRGELVTVKRRAFRNRLLPLGLAVYASPENIAKFEKENRDAGVSATIPKLTPYARLTFRQLEGMYLPIPMSGDNPWTLSKSHVKVALRRKNVELDETCLTLPEQPITEPGELTIGVTINGMETAQVKARIYLTYKDASKNIIPDMPQLFQVTVRLWKNKIRQQDDQK